MIKAMTALLCISVSTSLMAESCFPLYEKKAEEIQQKDGYSKYVGGQFYTYNNQLSYWPGVKVQADIDNWADDFVTAIKYGPFFYSSHDPRQEWLDTFRKAIKGSCDPSEDQLRTMLKELMEDGSFCPGQKILEPKLLGGKSAFKKVLENAVKDQRFVQYCQDKSVVDESFREVKDLNKKVPGDQKGQKAGQQ